MNWFVIATMSSSIVWSGSVPGKDSLEDASLRDSSNAILTAPINSELLKKYNEEVAENPQKYKRRWQRTLILLQHGDTAQTTAGDIEFLLTHPTWRGQGLRLKAMYRYLQGRLEEAKELMRQNIHEGTNVVEQAGFLAKIALSAKDTGAAIAAYRLGWDQHPDEDIYVELLRSYRGRWNPPEELLDQGLQSFPLSPGVMKTIFEAYSESDNSSSQKKILAMSERAEKTLWPMSVDWKIKHAQALIAIKKPEEAEALLLAALDLLDGDPRLEEGGYREKVFKLFEAVKK